MKYSMTLAAVVGCILWLAGSSLPAGEVLATPVKTSTSAEKVKAEVTAFYAALEAGNTKLAQTMFMHPENLVSGVSHFREAKPWQLKSNKYVEKFGDKPSYLNVDSIQIDQVHDGLAVARVTYRTSGAKSYSVLTLTAHEKSWRIASLYEETYLVW